MRIFPRKIQLLFAGLLLVGSIANLVPMMAQAQSVSQTTIKQEMTQALEARKSEFTLSVGTVSYHQLGVLFQLVLNSHDYLGNVIAQYGFSYLPGTLTIQVSYRENAAQYRAVVRRVGQLLATQILKKGMDAFQKEKAIHDYIITHVVYDTSLQDYTAYDALFLHQATCQGFALLTYEMLKQAGITNRIVVGTANNSFSTGSHAWNEVLLAGHWYQLDTTWDDPVPFQKNRLLYAYFNLTNAQLQADHTWQQTAYPVATTNYIATLMHASKRQDRAILQAPGLQAETPAYTFSNLTDLQRAFDQWQKNLPMTVQFRMKTQDLAQLQMLNIRGSIRYSYQTDPRDPRFSIIVLTEK